MSRDLHFSLDSLPQHLRAQAERQMAPGGAARETRANASLGVSSSFNAVTAPVKEKSAVKRKKRVCAPIRMASSPAGPNKTERQFNETVLLGKGKYEAVTLNLPGGHYTPDWFYQNQEDGDVFLVEVKGSYRLPTQGRSVFAFKSAVSEFPLFTFVFAELKKDGRTWNVGFYKDGRCLETCESTADQLMMRF